MEEVRYESQQAQAACYDNKFVLLSKLLEEFLLIFLRPSAKFCAGSRIKKYQGQGNFHSRLITVV
jgi:hypothetical protein